MPRYTHPVVLTHSVAAKWAGLERWRDIDVLAAKAPVMEKVVAPQGRVRPVWPSQRRPAGPLRVRVHVRGVGPMERRSLS